MVGMQLTSSNGGYDVAIVGSGMILGETTPQNQAVILTAHKGEFKEFPTMGVGIDDIANDHDFESWKRLITSELEGDDVHIVSTNTNRIKSANWHVSTIIHFTL